MRYKTLTDKETSDLIKKYHTLSDLIDEAHSISYSILEKAYNEYVQNFNPKVFFIFTRKLLTFDEFVSGVDDLREVSIKEFSGKKYLAIQYTYSPSNNHAELKITDKERDVIEIACKFGLDVYRANNKYINRMQKYAERPLQLDNDDFDRFDQYERWSTKIKEALDKYKAVP